MVVGYFTSKMVVWKFLFQYEDSGVQVQTGGAALLYFRALLEIYGEKASWKMGEKQKRMFMIK